VTIGDGCHLGAQAVVAAGTTIGDRCVIGANSFVKGDVPSRAIVVGSPARPVGMVQGTADDIRLWFGAEAVAALEGTSG
jgi:maltose O-acetyltransferase